MKLLSTLFALFFAGSLFSQTFCLQLREVSNDGSFYTVAIDVQGSAAFKLGSSNFQWSYNTTLLSNPQFVSSPLAPPFYQIPTVTTPDPGEVSFNVELGFAGFGTTMAADPGWTEIGQVKFTMSPAPDAGAMNWSYNGGTTQTVVYLDDEATQIYATSPLCLLGIDVPAAVELLTFAAWKNGGVVDLKWQTTNEDNNRGFEVQKSSDAKNWRPIGWVNGNGNSWIQQNYQLTDEHPFKGTNYYRLKQIDFDGKYTYSDIVSITLKQDAIAFYPNPTTGLITIGGNDLENAKYTVTDMAGKLLLNNVLSLSQIDLSTLPGGCYLVSVQTGDQVVVERVRKE